jgi:hypothetical protein
MKNRFIFLFALFCMIIPFYVQGQTSIPAGPVAGLWTKMNSPYLVQGDVVVKDSTTLRIEAGAKVIFQGNYKFLILGRVLAEGKVTDSIVLTGTHHGDTAGWRGFQFIETSNFNDSSRFNYCIFTYGNNVDLMDAGGALTFSKFSKAVISHCRFSDCTSFYGLAIHCDNSSPQILRNLFVNNRVGSGTVYTVNASQPLIAYNVFSHNNTFAASAILCKEKSGPLIYMNTIENNFTNGDGAIWSWGAHPTILKNRIKDNFSQYAQSYLAPGGIACSNGDTVKIIGNFIYNNSTIGLGGGGISIQETTATIKDNIISNNKSDNSLWNTAGGISCFGATVDIIHNQIDSNTVGQSGGGGIFFADSKGQVMYNFIFNNYVWGSGGGGIRLYRSDSLTTISNNIIVNNSAFTIQGGGGIYSHYGDHSRIINNTIAYNTCVNGGGLSFGVNSSPYLENNIIWGNKATNVGDQVFIEDEYSDPTIIFCDVQGDSAAFGKNPQVNYTGIYTNNLNTDPLFIKVPAGAGYQFNGADADWKISIGSACIDAGNPNGGPYPLLDIDGSPRVIGRIDIGPYEMFGTGIKNDSQPLSYTIYPNPSNGQFVIDIGTMQLQGIVIYNLLGECIYNGDIKTTKQVPINLKDQPKGVYIVCLLDNENSYFRKIMVQ